MKDPYATALRLLGLRPHSIAELTAKLRRKGFGPDEAAGTIERLLDAGYLNDERFAWALFESRSRNKGWGRMKIAAELSAKGVSKEIIERTAKTLDPEAEEKLVKDVLARWLRRGGSALPLDRAASAKAIRHLTGRGFSLDAALTAIMRLAMEEIE
ncbi:MAG: regulatory protein RecX [Deltaproteobacteria bacterium]|nr:regulatory protein RecX [Deltaproteobacteria bacterium]